MRETIDSARRQPGTITSLFVFDDHYGQGITASAFESAWSRLRHKMRQAGMEPFNFHALKVKGISDYAGNKMKLGGWKSATMVGTYDRKNEVDPVD